MSHRATYGAVVVGGGVAGLSAALYPGEGGRLHLRPGAHGLLALAPWRDTLPGDATASCGSSWRREPLETEGFLASHGLEATWGSEQPHHHSFLTNPYGQGWHVERRQLDALLARHAQEHPGAGAAADLAHPPGA